MIADTPFPPERDTKMAPRAAKECSVLRVLVEPMTILMLADRTGFSAGQLYPTLLGMERAGRLAVTWTSSPRRRRIYCRVAGDGEAPYRNLPYRSPHSSEIATDIASASTEPAVR